MPKKRITLILEKPLDHGLEVYCSLTDRTKQDVVRSAVVEYLKLHKGDIVETLENALAASA